jgi:hypothetical protein
MAVTEANRVRNRNDRSVMRSEGSGVNVGSGSVSRSGSLPNEWVSTGPDQAFAQDWCEVVAIDANVELARHRFQPSVTVPMQVQRTAVLPIPASERVVAQNKQSAVHLDFRIVPDASPAVGRQRRIRIVIATEQVLGAVQPGKQFGYIRRATGDVAQVPHHVIRANDGVPSLDQRLIHFGRVGKGTSRNIDRAVVAKMRVGREKTLMSAAPSGCMSSRINERQRRRFGTIVT